MAAKKHILITGYPGTGKTTLIVNLIRYLPGKKTGFVTKEVREGGARTGFVIETLGDDTGVKKSVPLAIKSHGGAPRVGSYRVMVKNIDEVAVPALLDDADFIVIDEIGKMECASPRFKEAVLQAFAGRGRVVATIAKKGVGFIKEIKRRRDVVVYEVTPKNRNSLLNVLIDEITGESPRDSLHAP
jgi:nucleoside-triphosphatase